MADYNMNRIEKLSPEEREHVFREVEKEYRLNDIRGKILDMYAEVEDLEIDEDSFDIEAEVPKTNKGKVLKDLYSHPEDLYDRVEHNLNRCDPYWEMFWGSLEDSIKDGVSDILHPFKVHLNENNWRGFGSTRPEDMGSAYSSNMDVDLMAEEQVAFVCQNVLVLAQVTDAETIDYTIKLKDNFAVSDGGVLEVDSPDTLTVKELLELLDLNDFIKAHGGAGDIKDEDIILLDYIEVEDFVIDED